MLDVRNRALGAVSAVALAAISCTGSVATEGEAISVTISPTLATLLPSASQAFAAGVTGTADTRVTWSVAEGAPGGSVTPTGAYTAPSSIGQYHVVVTSVADSTKQAIATVTVWDGVDVCSGLVQDKAAHPMTALAKPAAGEAVVDPQFGTTIRRISNAAGAGVTVVKPVYSTIQAWNADESYLMLYHTQGSPTGHFLYDGKTYALIKELNIGPADLEQVYWDTANPKILYYASSTSRRLYAYNVDTDTETVVHNFATDPAVSCASTLTGGGDPMWTSWDSRYFGFTCGTGTSAKKFIYDKQTDTVGAVVTMPGDLAPQPTPTGALAYYNPATSTWAEVYDRDMVFQRQLGVHGGEHATLGTIDGVDTHFSVQFDTNPAGTVIATDLTTGAMRTIIGESNGWGYPPTGTHLSAVAYKRPGWLAVSVVGGVNGADLLDQEVLLINANTGGTVCRVAHHRSYGDAYWNEPHASISPTGTRILFASDWGGGATVDTYVVELPAYGL